MALLLSVVSLLLSLPRESNATKTAKSFQSNQTSPLKPSQVVAASSAASGLAALASYAGTLAHLTQALNQNVYITMR